MPWKLTGITVTVIVILLIVLGRISGSVVDWAWFSSVGYVGVFWTVFAAKAAVFLAVFAASSLLLWANGTLALRFAAPRRGRHPTITRRAAGIVATRFAAVAMALVRRLRRSDHRIAGGDR